MEHRILVIDDDADNLASTELLLQDNGYTVDAVRTASEAIERVRQAKNSYALAILDYHLPDKTGAVALAELRSINPNLYVLVYSGDTKSRDPVKATLRGGAVDFMEKSEDPRYFLDIVKQWCTKFDETSLSPTRPVCPTRRRLAVHWLTLRIVWQDRNAMKRYWDFF